MGGGSLTGVSTRVRSIGWATAAALVTVAVACARLLVNASFYVADDSQTGTTGQWWHLGEQLLSGRIPLLDPHAWTAGNYAAEGQWGIFNPLVWLMAVWTRSVDDPLLAVTVVKVFLLGTMSIGVYLLARSFAAAQPLAAAAGVAAPLGGFTVYMDAPSWTTGLFTSALLPFAWWGLRRLVEEGRGPLTYLVSCGLLVTSGYVFGVIVLILVGLESVVRHLLGREWRRVWAVVGAGAFAGLLTVTTYLPGVLTSSVTVRDTSEILNTGFLNADLSDLAMASTATATGTVASWGTEATAAPLVYVLWALPALVLFSPSREVLRRLVPVFAVGGVLLLVMLGPDQVGPLRWPVRFMPYVVICVVIVFAVIVSEPRPARSRRRSLITALLIAGGVSWYASALTPWQLRQALISFAVQALGIFALWCWLHGVGVFRGRARSWVAAVIVVAGSLLVMVPQMYYFRGAPLPQLVEIRSVDAVRDILGDVDDDAIVVGSLYEGWRNPATYDERLIANQWYYADARVSSLYTVLPYEPYVGDLCADLRGSTCPQALSTLLSRDAHTGEQVATLLGVNTMVVIKSSFPRGLPALPEGWALAEERSSTWIVVREEPVAPAGGVAWTSPGTEVEQLEASALEVTLRVRSLGADAEAVLSRLAWPGYSVDGAEWGESVRDYLLTVDLSGTRPGDVVVVSFRPPGWAAEVGCLVVALVLVVMWPLARTVRRRRQGVPERV